MNVQPEQLLQNMPMGGGGTEQTVQKLPSHPDMELPLQTGPFEANKNWLVFRKE